MSTISEMSQNVSESIVITNTILPGFNFANHKGKEYHVFSGEITDPSECDGDWLAITSDKLVLTDPQTMKKLKNRKIHWMFDTEDILISAQVFSE
jgi:hypothetical protein|tara:strand:+ start:74 stop:358 length:285 start_codon:yes stop_codon:yes gene_type:complete